MAVLTTWITNPDGTHTPDLTLPAGCSATDITGQPCENIEPAPNSVTWEVWCPDSAAADAVADAVDAVLWVEDVEEVVDAAP
jgi:hypothetical protein